MKKSKQFLIHKKHNHEKITMLSCYDYPTTLWAEEAGVDIILVGDSVGVKMLGYESPEQVTMEDMLHHLKAVYRGLSKAYLIADLPLSSSKSKVKALDDSKRFIDHGADAIKIENFDIKIVEHLLDNQIEVCFDVLYPFVKDHFSKPGQDEIDSLVDVINTLLKLENAGVSLFLLTMFPEEASKIVSEILKSPVIGIGSGKYTDGQVLILAEMLGMVEPFDQGIYNNRYDFFAEKGRRAIKQFVQETVKNEFPTDKNSINLEKIHVEKLNKSLGLTE